MSTSSIAVSAQPGCVAIRLARCCVKANKVNASSETKSSTEAMMRAMILSLRADIVRADPHPLPPRGPRVERSEEHTSELQYLMSISYAHYCLKQKNNVSKCNK